MSPIANANFAVIHGLAKSPALPGGTEAARTDPPTSAPIAATAPSRQTAITQAIAAAAQKLAPAETTPERSDDVAAALKDFARALGYSLHAGAHGRRAEREDDGDRRERHDHGNDHRSNGRAYGHRHHHHARHAAQYEAMSRSTDRMQAMATRLEGAVPAEPVTPAVVVGAVGSVEPAVSVSVIQAQAANSDVAIESTTPAVEQAPMPRGMHRLMEAFATLQSALGLTPSQDPAVQRETLAGFLRDMADALQGGMSLDAEPAAAETGSLLQVAA